MRILMVTQYGCIRVLREALALKAHGHEVDVACPGNLFGREHLDTFSLYRGHDQLQRVVRASPADVIHVFNEPDDLVPVVREATSRPIVFDVQDLNSLRWGGVPSVEESAAFEAADGIVHISEPCREVAERHHGVKPSALLACYVNERFYSKSLPVPTPEAVVYEGGLATSATEGGVGNIRGLEAIVRAFRNQDFEFHLYPAGEPPPAGHYEQFGAVVHGSLFYPSLMQALRIYAFGFVGFPFSTPLGDAALPNKLFEYISQGVIPLVYNAATAAEFVEREGIGIAVTSLENLWEQVFPRSAHIREYLLGRRYDFTMEKRIGALEELYRDLLVRRARGAA